jgi:hypothetical protein
MKRIFFIVLVSLILFVLLSFLYFPEELAELTETIALNSGEQKPVGKYVRSPWENFYYLVFFSLNLFPFIYFILCRLSSKAMRRSFGEPGEANMHVMLFSSVGKFYAYYSFGTVLTFWKFSLMHSPPGAEIPMPWLLLLGCNVLIGYGFYKAIEALRKRN